MLDNFIFSISTVTPIFLVMCLGFIIKRKGIIDDNFTKCANRLVFYVALPLKLFSDTSKISIGEIFDIKLLAFSIIGSIISVLLAFAIASMFLKDKKQIGAFVQGSFRGNFLYIGLSLMENITGSIGLKAPLLIIFIVPLYNILAVIVLTITDTTRETKFNLLNVLKGIAKNPLIIGILLGVVVSQLGIEIPTVLDNTLKSFKSITVPLALLAIGATFNFDSCADNLKPSLMASSIKLVISPAIAVFIAYLLGFNSEDIVLVYVLFGVPSATVSYIMTAAMNGDRYLASNIIMITTILSVISSTMFIFVFKTVGLI